MKIVKIVFYGFCSLIILLGILALVFAFQPELTSRLSDFLYGEEDIDPDDTLGEGTPSDPEGDNNQGTLPVGDPLGTQTNPNAEANPDSDPQNGLNSPDSSSVQIEFVNIPADEDNKTGYEPVQVNSQEIGEEESNLLRSNLGYGQTGTNLTFDKNFYPYFHVLDAASQKLYRQIYANAMALNATFRPVIDAPLYQVKDAFAAVFNDHPSIFWLDAAYTCLMERNGTCLAIELEFYDVASQLSEAKRAFEESANRILAGVPENATNFDKELYIHNTLVSLVEYDLNASMHQSAYSALVNGRSVCAGYARAFQYLLQKLKIPCYYCTGYAGENHAWNIVRLDDDYYNVDSTWDDTQLYLYDFFNKTDVEFASTHIRQELSIYLPECKGTTYSYPKEGEDGKEQEPVFDFRRTLADVGISPDEVIYNLNDYYADCYLNIAMNGIGIYSFQNAIPRELWPAIFDAYQWDAYKEGYLDKALTDASASICSLHLAAEELKDGNYLLVHTVAVR